MLKVKQGIRGLLPDLKVGQFGFATDTEELFLGSENGNLYIATTVGPIDFNSFALTSELPELPDFSNIVLYPIATQVEAEEMIVSNKLMTPERTGEAISAYAERVEGISISIDYNVSSTEERVDYLADENTYYVDVTGLTNISIFCDDNYESWTGTRYIVLYGTAVTRCYVNTVRVKDTDPSRNYVFRFGKVLESLSVPVEYVDISVSDMALYNLYQFFILTTKATDHVNVLGNVGSYILGYSEPSEVSGEINPTDLIVDNSLISTVPLSVNAIIGTTANLQEWNVDGVNKAFIDKDGDFEARDITATNQILTYAFNAKRVTINDVYANWDESQPEAAPLRVGNNYYNILIGYDQVNDIGIIEVDYDEGTPKNLSIKPDVGYVGIGNKDPQYKLDLIGDLNFTGDLYQDGVLFEGGNTVDVTITNSLNGIIPLTVNAVSGQAAFLQSWQVNGVDKAAISNTGGILSYGHYLMLNRDADNSEDARIYFGDGASGLSHILSFNDANQEFLFNTKLKITGDLNFTGDLYQDGVLFSGGGDPLTAVLTGLDASTGGTVVATDTILEAFGRLENRVALNDLKSGGTGTVHDTPVDGADTAAISSNWAFDHINDVDIHGISGILGLQTALDSKTTETYVDNAISALVDSSPATLDTLNELAAALGDDPNFATTMTNLIAGKLSLTGGNLSGDIQLNKDGTTDVGSHGIVFQGNALTADFTKELLMNTSGMLLFNGDMIYHQGNLPSYPDNSDYVDLSTNQSINGEKTFNDAVRFDNELRTGTTTSGIQLLANTIKGTDTDKVDFNDIYIQTETGVYFSFTTTGRFGIGMVSPDYDFEVDGTAGVQGILSLFSQPIISPVVIDGTTEESVGILFRSRAIDLDVDRILKTNDAGALLFDGNIVYHAGNLGTPASESYVDTAIANLIDTAPGTLDTLNEIAAALGDDPNFSTTITNSIANKLSLTGGTLTGDLTLDADGAGTVGSHGIVFSGELSTIPFTKELLMNSLGALIYDGNEAYDVGNFTDNSSNWDLAYGWGDHSLVGYLESETSHTDVLVDSDFLTEGIMLRGATPGSYSILTDNSANWNTAFGWGNHDGLYSLLGHDHSGVYSLTDHTHSGFLTSGVADTMSAELTMDAELVMEKESPIGGYARSQAIKFNYQDNASDLSKLLDVSSGGLLKFDDNRVLHDGNFVLDTDYINAITQGMVEAVLTGEITTHTHPGGAGMSDWNLGVDGVYADITDGENVNFVSGTDIDLVYAAQDNTITINFDGTYTVVHDTPADGETGIAASSNWAYDHINASNPHGISALTIGLSNVEDKSAATILGELTEAQIEGALTNILFSDGLINLGGYNLSAPAGVLTFNSYTVFHSNNFTDNSSNWDLAYGWGDHSVEGYLTSETSHADVLVDVDFTSQGIMLRGATPGSYSILADNSANWNTAFGWGNHDGLYEAANTNIQTHIGNTTTNPHSVDATDVGLGNVDNTADDTKYVLGVEETNASANIKIWTGTAAQYALIGTKDSNTLYFVT